MTEGVTVMSLRLSQPELGDRFTAATLHEVQGGVTVCIQQQLNVKSTPDTSKMECLCCRTLQTRQDFRSAELPLSCHIINHSSHGGKFETDVNIVFW